MEDEEEKKKRKRKVEKSKRGEGLMSRWRKFKRGCKYGGGGDST